MAQVPGIGAFAAVNYRHLFHAGNFADVLKHALLLEQLATLTSAPGSLQVLDTHAGAGLYDLSEPAAARTGEAAQGVGRLMDDMEPPPPLARLKAAVRALNPGGDVRWYPGSPRLALDALRPGDAWTGCELHEAEARALRAALSPPPGVNVQVRLGDGYAAAAEPTAAQRLILVDPPFERADDPDRIVTAVEQALRSPKTTVSVWLPLKDLDGYDRLLSRVEAVRPPPSLAVQVRLRPLTDPMKMNGCAMLLIGGAALEAAAIETANWVARRCGEAHAGGRVTRFGG